MKIAVWYNLPSGGAKRALYYHVRGLVERGHHVEAWCPPSADQTYLPLNELVTEHIVPLGQSARKPRFSIGHALNNYYATVDAARRMDEHCESCADQIHAGAFDLLFANSCVAYAAAGIGRYVDLPKVLYLQEPRRDLYEASPILLWVGSPSAPKNRWSLRDLKRSLSDTIDTQSLRVRARQELSNAQAYDVILVNSYFSRESVLRSYNLDAKVCYLGIDTDLFVNQNCERENFVVGLGQISPHKNTRFVIEALAATPSPRPRLVWIGNVSEPSYLEEMKTLAKNHGVEFETRVRVSNDELCSLLNRAKLMLYAPRLEPFGFAPLEGNACGLPVVAVSEGGIRETVIDGVNGLIVENTPEAMGMATERLLNDEEYAAKIGAEGRCLVLERWSLSSSVDRIEKALLQAAGLSPS